MGFFKLLVNCLQSEVVGRNMEERGIGMKHEWNIPHGLCSMDERNMLESALREVETMFQAEGLKLDNWEVRSIIDKDGNYYVVRLENRVANQQVSFIVEHYPSGKMAVIPAYSSNDKYQGKANNLVESFAEAIALDED